VGAVLAVAAPLLAGALTRGGSHALSTLVQEGMRAVPDTTSYARSAAAGKFEMIAYEGPTQLTTWSQATGLWTTTDYQTGERYTSTPNSLIQVEGPYGSYTMDRAHRVVAGTKTVKREDGSLLQIEGFGGGARETLTQQHEDGSASVTTRTYVYGQGDTKQLQAENYERRYADGTIEQASLSGEGTGTVERRKVTETGLLQHDTLNAQTRQGTRTEEGTIVLPMQIGNRRLEMPVNGQIISRLDNEQATPVYAAFDAVTDAGVQRLYADYDQQNNAFRIRAGQTNGVIRMTGVEPGPDGKLVAIETAIDPKTEQVVNKQFKAGISGSDTSAAYEIDGRLYRGESQTLVAEDGSQIIAFQGTVTGPDGERRVTGWITTDPKTGRRRFIEEHRAGGLFGHEAIQNATIGDVTVLGGTKEYVPGPKGSFIETITGVFQTPDNQTFAGAMRVARDAKGNPTLVTLSGERNRTLEAVESRVEENIRRGVKVLMDPETKEKIPYYAVEYFEPGQPQTPEHLLTASYINLQTKQGILAWNDPSTGQRHLGVGTAVLGPNNQWRIQNLQETAHLDVNTILPSGQTVTERIGATPAGVPISRDAHAGINVNVVDVYRELMIRDIEMNAGYLAAHKGGLDPGDALHLTNEQLNRLGWWSGSTQAIQWEANAIGTGAGLIKGMETLTKGGKDLAKDAAKVKNAITQKLRKDGPPLEIRNDPNKVWNWENFRALTGGD